jgi:hypothetical protein
LRPNGSQDMLDAVAATFKNEGLRCAAGHVTDLRARFGCAVSALATKYKFDVGAAVRRSLYERPSAPRREITFEPAQFFRQCERPCSKPARLPGAWLP